MNSLKAAFGKQTITNDKNNNNNFSESIKKFSKSKSDSMWSIINDN